MRGAGVVNVENATPVEMCGGRGRVQRVIIQPTDPLTEWSNCKESKMTLNN